MQTTSSITIVKKEVSIKYIIFSIKLNVFTNTNNKIKNYDWLGDMVVKHLKPFLIVLLLEALKAYKFKILLLIFSLNLH